MTSPTRNADKLDGELRERMRAFYGKLIGSGGPLLVNYMCEDDVLSFVRSELSRAGSAPDSELRDIATAWVENCSADNESKLRDVLKAWLSRAGGERAPVEPGAVTTRNLDEILGVPSSVKSSVLVDIRENVARETANLRAELAEVRRQLAAIESEKRTANTKLESLAVDHGKLKDDAARLRQELDAVRAGSSGFATPHLDALEPDLKEHLEGPMLDDIWQAARKDIAASVNSDVYKQVQDAHALGVTDGYNAAKKEHEAARAKALEGAGPHFVNALEHVRYLVGQSPNWSESYGLVLKELDRRVTVIVSQAAELEELRAGHHENCDVFERAPDLGPSQKPCNCRGIPR